MALTRRRFLTNTTAAGVATFATLQFGAPGAYAQTEEGTISIALAARAPSGINPQQSGLTGGDNWAIYQVFNGLVQSRPGTFAVTPDDFQPALAESWDVSEDARTWTYHLRQGVQFHHGYGEMTSRDVMFTYGRQIDPDVISAGKVLFNNIESIDAPDDYTFVVTLVRQIRCLTLAPQLHWQPAFSAKTRSKKKGRTSISTPLAPAPISSKAPTKAAYCSPPSPIIGTSRRPPSTCASPSVPTPPRARLRSRPARST